MKRANRYTMVLLLGALLGHPLVLADEGACCKKPKPGEATAADEPVAGIEIPDVELVDQNGAPVRFFSDLVADRLVAVNFVFTTCTTICPPMGASFGRLQDLLADRLGKDVHLISVSLDPIVDTPERLDAWSARFGRRDGWTLVTGDKQQVDRVLRAMGALVPDKSDHAPLVLVGNAATDSWTRVNGLAAPTKIIDALNRVGNGNIVAEVRQP